MTTTPPARADRSAGDHRSPLIVRADCSTASPTGGPAESRSSRRRPAAARRCSFAPGSMSADSPTTRRGSPSNAGSEIPRGSGSRWSRGCAAPSAPMRSSRSSRQRRSSTGKPVVDASSPSSARWKNQCCSSSTTCRNCSRRRRSPSSTLAPRPPPRLLRCVLATRRDPQLGLHRLRLAGELARGLASDLRFTIDETRDLLAACGWQPMRGRSRSSTRVPRAPGRRSAAGGALARPPTRSRAVRRRVLRHERTVADYLLASAPARAGRHEATLVRTSILERVSGPLAMSSSTAPGRHASCSSSKGKRWWSHRRRAT